APGAAERAGPRLLVEWAGAWVLGIGFAQYGVLARRQQSTPFRVGVPDLEALIRRFGVGEPIAQGSEDRGAADTCQENLSPVEHNRSPLHRCRTAPSW